MTNPNPTMPSAPDFLSWQEVEKLVDYLLPQLRGPYDAMMLITRGGIVPGGLIAEALEMTHVLTAAVQFPEAGQARLAWPTFLQFPEDRLLRDKKILIIDDQAGEQPVPRGWARLLCRGNGSLRRVPLGDPARTRRVQHASAPV